MSYRRADDVLPKNVLEILQMYVSGETIYVPQKEACREKWGSGTGVSERLRIRNEEIFVRYQSGISIKELAQSYYLTEKSIQRILRNMRKKPPVSSSSRNCD